MIGASFQGTTVFLGLIVAACFLISPAGMKAQGSGALGNNAVFSSSSACLRWLVSIYRCEDHFDTKQLC